MLQTWNTLSSTELYLDGPSGKFHALAVADQMLFFWNTSKSPALLSIIISVTCKIYASITFYSPADFFDFPFHRMAWFWHGSLALQPIPLNIQLPLQGTCCLLSH
jgi:hypothetical protein